ncbi:MAG TPA: lysylphosphatidylglycerol synthase transmembrane domain-containing protein [Bryobacteraceae bacterium]|nr:lysylphosphatidylglycerol synthase transmembrane domain-containing protein [Bryobacteraceae bacterium]
MAVLTEMAKRDGPSRRMPSWLPQVLGYLISAGCLIWVLHGYPIRQLPSEIRGLDWKWVSLGILLDLSVYVTHAWRWDTLLGPVVRLRFWRTVQAIYIGLFANEVLPLRTGELIRCYLLAHWSDLRLSLSFASAAVERLIDGFWMLAAFLITASFVRGIPHDLIILVQALGVLLFLGAAVLIWVVFHRQHAHYVVSESRWASTLRHVIEGLHLMGNLRTMSLTVLVSLMYLALQILSVWALMKAYGFDLSVWVAGGVLAIIRFGTVVPNAPGNLGLYQVACVVALKLFDVEQNAAKGFSILLFLALTVPLLIGGAIAVALTGLNIGELRDRARRGMETVESDV